MPRYLLVFICLFLVACSSGSDNKKSLSARENISVPKKPLSASEMQQKNLKVYCDRVKGYQNQAKKLLYINPYRFEPISSELKEASLAFCDCIKEGAKRPSDEIPSCVLPALQKQSMYISRAAIYYQDDKKYKQSIALKANRLRDECVCGKL